MRGEPELGQRTTGRAVREAEQPDRFVVGELEATLVVDEEQPLGDGVEDGVVVLVHLPQLRLAQPERLAAGAPGDESGADPGEQRRRGPGDEQGRELCLDRLGQFGASDADGDEADDRPGVGVHRDDDAAGRAEGPGVVLDDFAALQGVVDVTEEALAHLSRIGVGEPHSTRRHDDDEVGLRRLANLFGEGLHR